jgi:hypothetical protein
MVFDLAQHVSDIVSTAQVRKNCLKKVINCDFAGLKKKKKKKKKILWRFDKE